MPSVTLAQRVRLAIFERFRARGAPPVIEELMVEFSITRDEALATLRELDAGRHIALVPGTGRILMAFPFSAIATPFRVASPNGRWFANCAWDAVAFHTMLGTDIDVDSHCHHCAQPIRVEMRDGRATVVEPAETIIYLALPPARWWDDIITTCANTMVFFAGPDHREASDLCGPADESVSLTPDGVHALSGPIYDSKFAVDYARPSRDKLLAHFDRLGLTGPYWAI